LYLAGLPHCWYAPQPYFKAPAGAVTARGFATGEVIRKDAAAKDIFADARTTLTKAVARGEPYKTPAEQKLGPMLAAVDILEAKHEAAVAELGPKVAAVAAADDEADALIGQTADNVWNDIGRPAFDPGYELVFPGGISYYTRGSDVEQPERMRL